MFHMLFYSFFVVNMSFLICFLLQDSFFAFHIVLNGFGIPNFHFQSLSFLQSFPFLRLVLVFNEKFNCGVDFVLNPTGSAFRGIYIRQ